MEVFAGSGDEVTGAVISELLFFCAPFPFLVDILAVLGDALDFLTRNRPCNI